MAGSCLKYVQGLGFRQEEKKGKGGGECLEWQRIDQVAVKRTGVALIGSI